MLSALGLFSLAVASAAQTSPTFTRPPASFETNLGQWPEAVLFHSRSGSVHAWLDAEGCTLALLERVESNSADADERAWCLRMEWESAPLRIAPRAPQESSTSRFSGGSYAGWRRADLRHGAVALEELAPGVNLVARAGGERLEFDLEVASGSAPEAVVMRWSGHCGLRLDASGDLHVATGLGELTLPRPIALEFDGARAEWLMCEYQLLDDERFCIRAERRTPHSALWIDPALHWGTYLGGQSQQSISSLEVLPSGAVVVAGVTESIDYPTVPGAFQPFYSGGIDAFVSVLAADGTSLLHSTLLCGAADDRIVGLAVAPGGGIVVAGDTTSVDFPTTPGAFDRTFEGSSDAFVARLSSDLSTLDWSTLIGGSLRDGAGGMALRPNGAAVLVGSTRGAGFPVTSGAHDVSYNGGQFAGDAFALEVASNGASVVWGTYLGGPSEELAERVTLDSNGSVTLSGMAYGAGFPTTVGAFDRNFDGFEEPFVVRLNAQGSALQFSTFFGGAGEDTVLALLVRSDGATVLGGRTTDSSWPLTALAHDRDFKGATEGFLALLAPAGDALWHSSFVGGGEDDAVTALHVVDASEHVVVGAQTLSGDLPTTPGAYDRNFDASLSGSEIDTYLLRMKPDLSVFDYATYFGGRNPERLIAIDSDAQGALLLAGSTNGASLPTTPSAFQPAWNITSLSEGFVARLELLLHPIPFGTSQFNSGGGAASIQWSGFPSVSDHDFAVGVDFATPNAWCTVFSGLEQADTPFCGGRIRVRPPFTRYPRFKSDSFGYGMRAVPLAPWMAGSTLFFQLWYVDDNDPLGCGLTDGLAVLVQP